MNQAKMMSSKDRRILFVILSVVIVALIVDTSIVKVYRLITPPLFLEADIAAFIIIALIYAVAQYAILRHVKGYARASKFFASKQIHSIVFFVQYILTAIIAFVILQMIIFSAYSSVVVVVAVAVSYILSIVMTGLLTVRFFSWFTSSRNIVVLAYSLAAASLSINSAFTLIYVSDGLLNMSSQVMPHIGHFTSFSPYSVMLNSAYVITNILSFSIMWVATSLLLRHHSRRIGAMQYWILVTIPLVYFLSQFHPLFLDLLSDYRSYSPILFNVLYTMIFSLSKPIGGILFGLVFWIIARSVAYSKLTDYLMVAGFGVLLFFTSNQAAVLINLPYPPFGMATISFVGLSSYLLFVGIYASAVSVAEDSKLRTSIRKLALKESKLLDSIGSAQMEHEIQRRVITMTKKTKGIMSEQTGVESSLSEEDIKQYLYDVLTEVKKRPS